MSADSGSQAAGSAPAHMVAGKTSDFYQVNPKLPERFNNPDWYVGYGEKADTQHPMYRTTNASTYGSRRPNPHTMPTSYRGKSQKFSQHLGQAGMYKNDSLHTALDKKMCDKAS